MPRPALSESVCPTLDPTDEMVRIGGVCIDKYEASIWDAPVGGNQITGPIPCSANGQDCDNIYARSVAGVEPREDITWFQAQQALANSGKRLPTNAEWQVAVAGTPDGFPCNLNSGDPVVTGSLTGCVSNYGVFDMVGNLWEWVADWDEDASGCASWGAGFGSDRVCMGGDPVTHLPGALMRGGFYSGFGFGVIGGPEGGPFAVNAGTPPSNAFDGIGFRGAR